MKSPDLDKQRSEKKLLLAEFLKSYNDSLPKDFPRATLPVLEKFRENYPSLFKADNLWTLDQHRKKLMDWLPQYLATK